MNRYLPDKLAALALSVAIAGAVTFSGHAHAGQILAETGVFIGDPSAEYALNVTGSGTLSVNLLDYAWPSPLADLSLEIASSTQVLGQMTGPGQATFSMTGPGTYYAYVTGDAGGALGIGAYGLVADFQTLGQTTPVPLPPSVSLLLGGMAASLWSIRRKRRIMTALGMPAAAA